MIKYYKELENRSDYYLPLVDIQTEGKSRVFDYKVPLHFIEKYHDLFENSEFLIDIYKNNDIDKFFSNSTLDWEEKCFIYREFEDINEDFSYVLENYGKINFTSIDLENYLYLIEKLSYLYEDIFPKNKDYFTSVNERIKVAIRELKNINTIIYDSNREDNIYQPDAWYITPNGYLYNCGKQKDGYGHAGRDVTFNFNRIKNLVKEGNLYENNGTSNGYLELSRQIREKGYITAGQFKRFLNYISQPVYLEEINGVPIAREKHIVDLILGIVNAQACFYRFFEDLCIFTEKPQNEIDKLVAWTKDDIRDVLVRCCGFHKIESMREKTITTSCVNYETEFEEYIKNGWNVEFIPPIILDKYNRRIMEYPNEFLSIKKVLKK